MEKAQRDASIYLEGFSAVSAERDSLNQKFSKIEKENDDLAGQLKAAEHEILVLKARLYDYMVQSA